MKTFNLSVRTPEKELFSGKVIELITTAVDGEIGILADHAPLVTALNGKKLKITQEDGSKIDLATDPGYLIVNKNRAAVLS